MPETIAPLILDQEIAEVPCLKEHLDKLNKSFLKVKTREELEDVFREIVWTLRALVRKKVIYIAFWSRTEHHTPFSKNVYSSCLPDTEESRFTNAYMVRDFDILSALALWRDAIYAKTPKPDYDWKIQPDAPEKAFFFSGRTSEKFTSDTSWLGYFSIWDVVFWDGNDGICKDVSSQEIAVWNIIDSVFSRVQTRLQAIAATEVRQQESDLKHKKAVLQLPEADKTIKNRNSLEGDQDYMRRLFAGTITIPSL